MCLRHNRHGLCAQVTDDTAILPHCARAAEDELHLPHAVRDGARLDHAHWHARLQQRGRRAMALALGLALRHHQREVCAPGGMQQPGVENRRVGDLGRASRPNRSLPWGPERLSGSSRVCRAAKSLEISPGRPGE